MTNDPKKNQKERVRPVDEEGRNDVAFGVDVTDERDIEEIKARRNKEKSLIEEKRDPKPRTDEA